MFCHSAKSPVPVNQSVLTNLPAVGPPDCRNLTRKKSHLHSVPVNCRLYFCCTNPNIMRKIILVNFITLDGVIQSPGGPQEDTSGNFQWGGWVAPFGDDMLHKKLMAVMEQPFDLLLGRRTYDIFAAHWPHYDDFVGKKFNGAEKFVVSHHNIPLPWEHTTLITDDVVAQLQALKKTDGPDLQVYGSSGLVQTLLKHQLVDIAHLWLHPVTIGSGKRLFENGTLPGSWKLTDAIPTSTGVILITYEAAGALQTRAIDAKPPSAAELERRKKVQEENAKS